MNPILKALLKFCTTKNLFKLHFVEKSLSRNYTLLKYICQNILVYLLENHLTEKSFAGIYIYMLKYSFNRNYNIARINI